MATGSNRWEGGFGFVPEACREPESWVIPCVGPGASVSPGAALNTARGPLSTAYLEWRPYVIRASFKCDAQQLQAIDFEARARRIFEQGESKLMETELYRGDAAGFAANALNPLINPYNLTLTEGTSLTLGGASAPGIALRALVQAAAAAPGSPRGMIHATHATAVAWQQSGGVIQDRDGRLITVVGGHTVIAGAGYTGEGPGNTATGSANIHWAWITTPVYWLRGAEIEVLPSVNQLTNDAEVIVQRTACAYFDGCLHAGLPVDVMGSVL